MSIELLNVYIHVGVCFHSLYLLIVSSISPCSHATINTNRKWLKAYKSNSNTVDSMRHSQASNFKWQSFRTHKSMWNKMHWLYILHNPVANIKFILRPLNVINHGIASRVKRTTTHTHTPSRFTHKTFDDLMRFSVSFLSHFSQFRMEESSLSVIKWLYMLHVRWHRARALIQRFNQVNSIWIAKIALRAIFSV